MLISSQLHKLSKFKRKVQRDWQRLRTPISPDEMRFALDRITGGGAELLFVHSSLSSCGQFTAGPTDVLCGLGEFCSTLVLPTHSYCYPSSPDTAGEIFDPRRTPSQNGILTEIFRKKEYVVRSIHATHSLAASGPDAEAICAGHYRADSPCGVGTPYERLTNRHASALMFGVTFYSYTFFHTAEFESGSVYAYERGTVDRLRVLDEQSTLRECLSQRQSRTPYRFKEAGDLMERMGLVRRESLGRDNLLFVRDTSEIHEFMLKRLRQMPDFLRQSCAVALH